MILNRTLLEAGGIKRHFMTAEERKVKKELVALLVSKKHPKYARRFIDFDFNLVDATKFPDFTAAVSFDEATVYLSTGFLGSGPAIFNQLDVLLRHELAHNLMMHQIRMMYIYKQQHSDDPEHAADSLSSSMSLHQLMNVIEDLEISNKRYSAADKKIVHYMTLNGRLIGGLVTDELRANWVDMSLEEMFDELSAEIAQINIEIRNDPDWNTSDPTGRYHDPIKLYTAKAIMLYADASAPSKIYVPISEYVQTKDFAKIEPHIKAIMQNIFIAFKDVEADLTDQDKDAILDIVNQIAATGPQEKFTVTNPLTGEFICDLYSPEEKLGAVEVLKNLGGLINTGKFKPKAKAKVKIKQATHSKEYTDTWNNVVTTLCNSGDYYDDQVLLDLLAEIVGN